jgi:hypothetical protein
MASIFCCSIQCPEVIRCRNGLAFIGKDCLYFGYQLKGHHKEKIDEVIFHEMA